ncbi:MAG: TolB family protein [Gaiellaceae bacterium]
MRWVWLTLGALALLLGGPVAAASRPAAGEVPGRIAFDSDRDGTWNVYLANADGSAARQISKAGGYSAAWSPDGSRLAFTDGKAVYVADAEGTNVRRLADGVDQSWSPDGKRLAFMRGWAIYVVNVDGSGLSRLTTPDREDVKTLAALPSWSPDGTRIAYETLDGLFLVGVDGTGGTRLSTWGADPDSDARPRWSPDGSSIAYVAATCCATGGADGYEYRKQTPTLQAIELAGRSVRTIAEDVDDEFAWSPDGTRIAFSRPLSEKDDAPREVFTAPGGGGQAFRVTQSAVGEHSWAPSWSPDGEWLTYLHGRLPARFYSGGTDVALIRADGTGGRQLTQSFPTGGSNMGPAWGAGTVEPQPAGTASPTVEVSARGVTRNSLFWEVAASGSQAAVLSSVSDTPVLWKPGEAVLTRTRATDLESGDFYGLVMAGGYAAWFSTFAHGVVDPVTDVSLVLTSIKTKRSLEIASTESPGHDLSYEDGPRLAGDGPLLVYNPDKSGSLLYRIDTTAKKPKLRLVARRLAVETVDAGRIVGWRGDRSLVTLDAMGHVVGSAAFRRSETTSVRLDGSRLFTTSGDRLSLTSLNGAPKRSWQLVNEGGGAPTLAGVKGDIAVYVSGVAVHVLSLSTGKDVVLALVSQGPGVDVALTRRGLFFAYNSPYTQRPGRLGYLALASLSSLVR